MVAEKPSAHSSGITSVLFSPDGSQIVSADGSDDKSIKVWDAVNFRPHIDSEWEEFSKEVKERPWSEPEMQTWWRNNVTGHEQSVKSSGSACMRLELGTIKVWDAGRR